MFPEQLSPDHTLVAQTAEEFLAHEVLPAIPDLEQKRWDISRKLIERCGELGLLGTDVPEEYGGVGLDKVASVLVGEVMGAAGSFATSFGAQTGLAIIPIIGFGTDAQKQKYLPRITSGELIGAYCLSESGAGSDAMSARTKATRQADGSWVLTGEKMWITNGGFADLFIVFAKVDGEKFSAFIVERGPGVVSGKEEHKMGLHGSSTTPLLLQDARVPADALLGDVGKGHKIAFNVLNYGRFKLCAMCTGGAKAAIAEAVQYAAARRQFGQPIASFGAIQHKIGDMTTRAFVVESMLYRVAGSIDAAIAKGASAIAAFEQHAIEASMLKVAGSEMVDFVIDEDVQIHGGNGFVSDYPAERRYRDARVNRIFEGTNEINRIIVATRSIKAAPPTLHSSPLEATASALIAAAKARYGDAVDKEQEVLTCIADVLMDAFGVESAAARADAAKASGHPRAALMADAAAVFRSDATDRAGARARMALAAMKGGDALRAAVADVDRALAADAVDTIGARRRLAAAAIDRRGYVFAR